MIEATMFYENTVLKRPKQLEIGRKRNYCCIPVFEKAHYDKDKQKVNWYGKFS